ncbi:MAG TPA: LysM domain-containing protein, partial [bacterium]|nr:LysM domain-containing protein [bacterium]
MNKILMVLKLDIKSFNFIFFIFNYLFFFACFNCAIKPGIYYEVKKNESLRDISERYNIPLKAIYRTNEKKVLENIKEGTKIFLPGIKSLKEENKTKEKISIVKKSEEIKTTKSNKKKVKENVEIKKNIENNERDIIINNKKIEFKKPIEGKIIGYFGI